MIVTLKRNYIHNLCVLASTFVFFFAFFPPLELYDDYTQATLMCVTYLSFVRILLKKSNTKKRAIPSSLGLYAKVSLTNKDAGKKPF